MAISGIDCTPDEPVPITPTRLPANETGSSGQLPVWRHSPAKASIRYAPSPGKHRIFIVDEVHMLSKPAFNALLKTLEEPPPRSLFVFATTNPEKIPYTVISRCQRHDLRRLPVAELLARLREVAASEGVEIESSTLSMRLGRLEVVAGDVVERHPVHGDVSGGEVVPLDRAEGAGE